VRTYLGVDGGGSRTAFALLASDSRILGRTDQASSYYFEHGLDHLHHGLAGGLRRPRRLIRAVWDPRVWPDALRATSRAEASARTRARTRMPPRPSGPGGIPACAPHPTGPARSTRRRPRRSGGRRGPHRSLDCAGAIRPGMRAGPSVGAATPPLVARFGPAPCVVAPSAQSCSPMAEAPTIASTATAVLTCRTTPMRRRPPAIDAVLRRPRCTASASSTDTALRPDWRRLGIESADTDRRSCIRAAAVAVHSTSAG
jgi:hypothetical protein